MTLDHRLTAFTLALTLCSVAACDTGPAEEFDSTEPDAPTVVTPETKPKAEPVDAPAGQAGANDEASDAEFSVVGHAEVATVLATQWVEEAMKQHMETVDADFEACARVLQGAEAITFGASEDSFEAYITGQLELDDASACGDKIDTSSGPGSAVVLDEDLFVLYRGEFEPSRARLGELLARDPFPQQTRPLWLTGAAISVHAGSPVETVVAWADLAQGLDVHAQIELRDEREAAEIYGQATLGLTALRMSDDSHGLASAVQIGNEGKILTVDVRASAEQMASVVREAMSDVHAERREHHAREGSDVHFELHTSD